MTLSIRVAVSPPRVVSRLIPRGDVVPIVPIVLTVASGAVEYGEPSGWATAEEVNVLWPAWFICGVAVSGSGMRERVMA